MIVCGFNCKVIAHIQCCVLLSFTGQGGYSYLKEWLWWAGLISSKVVVCKPTFSWIPKCVVEPSTKQAPGCNPHCRYALMPLYSNQELQCVGWVFSLVILSPCPHCVFEVNIVLKSAFCTRGKNIFDQNTIFLPRLYRAMQSFLSFTFSGSWRSC